MSGNAKRGPTTRHNAVRGGQSAKKKTTRIMKRPGAAGGDEGEEEERFAPPPPPKDNTMIYVGVGVGAVVLLIIVGVVMSGGESAGNSHNAEVAFKRTLQAVIEARNQGDHGRALQLADEALSNPRNKKFSQYSTLQAMADADRAILGAEREAVGKVADFKRRIDKAKEDQTAMAKAKEFWSECTALMQMYGGTSSAQELKNIRDDLRRWVATEEQSDWQKDYNRWRERVEREFLNAGNFNGGVREWMKFLEQYNSAELKGKIDSELVNINLLSKTAAEKLVMEAGSGADARSKLEAAMELFNQTDGAKVIKKALGSMK